MLREDQRRVLEARGFDADLAGRHFILSEQRRREALSRPAAMPREWAAGVLEMLRMCWAKSEPWDPDAQDEMAYWIWDRYPELYAENESGCFILVFEPRGLNRTPQSV